MHLKFRNVNDAFIVIVKGIYSGDIKTTTLPSRVGEVQQVEEPVIVSYDRPIERVLFNEARDANCFFHLYEAMWMLAGRNTVEELDYYASDYSKITSDDGGKTANGAYGFRWRYHPGGMERQGNMMVTKGVDQLSIIIEQLKSKPHSRRVVLQMWNVRDDLLKIDVTKDVCCNLCAMFSVEQGPCLACDGDGSMSYQWAKEACVKSGGKQMPMTDGRPGWYYVTRDGKEIEFKTIGGPCSKCGGTPSNQPRYLNMTVVNRSNDLIWGLLGANVVHFSFLQEYLAAHIGLEVGTYHQVTNNMHCYTERWYPAKWLDGYVGPRDAFSPHRWSYEQDVKHIVPLVVDPARFDEELGRFVAHNERAPSEVTEWGGIRVGYSEPFLHHVAQPMMYAFHYHKQRNYTQALFEVEKIKDDAWRIVSHNWIKKRMKNWESKKKGPANETKPESDATESSQVG